MNPLVSIICLCYNHERFVREALESVFIQSYKQLEIIVVDDYSSDSSRIIIEEIIGSKPEVTFIANNYNIGNCKSFNKALAQAKGKYIVDFSTDDAMLPDRVEQQVKEFEKLGEEYGVGFTNAIIITENGKEIKLHHEGTAKVPVGNVYKDVLEQYFISPPTMMIRRTVLVELGGYDETLEYEDFDFWVRSSRNYKYFYINEPLTKRRVSSGSHSTKFYRKGFDRMSESTYRVIQKAHWLNKSEKENSALIKRVKYEMRQAFYMEKFDLVKKYSLLLHQLKGEDVSSRVVMFLSRFAIPVYLFYKGYLRFFK